MQKSGFALLLGMLLASILPLAPGERWASAATGPLILHKDEGDRRLRRPRAAGVQPVSASTLIIKVSPQLGGSKNFFMAYEELESGAEIPVHRHRAYDEILFVHRGAGVARLGDRTTAVGEGTTIYIPAATQVGLRNTGETRLQVVFIFPHPEKVAAYYADLTVSDGEAAKR